MIKVLVIEDDAAVRENLIDLLDAEGYEPVSARDGETGLALILREKPDLVICDIMMPGMGGYEVLKRVSLEPEMTAVPFIFLTARTNRDDIRKGMELGADDYITKPYTRDDILHAIRLRLSKKDSLKLQVQDRQTKIQTSINRIVPHTILEQVSGILDTATHLMNDEELTEAAVREFGRQIYSSGNHLLRLINQLILLSDIEMANLDSTRAAELRRGQVEAAWDSLSSVAMIYAKEFNRLPDLRLDGKNVRLAMPELYYQALVEEMVGAAMRYSHSGQILDISAFPDLHHEYYLFRMIEQGRRMTDSDLFILSANLLPDRQTLVASGSSIKPLLVRQLVDFFGGTIKVRNGEEEGIIVDIRLPILKSV